MLRFESSNILNLQVQRFLRESKTVFKLNLKLNELNHSFLSPIVNSPQKIVVFSSTINAPKTYFCKIFLFLKIQPIETV